MQQDSTKISSIKTLHDLSRRNKIFIDYQLEKESGPSHAKLYTIRLRFGEKEYIGIDRSIKLAQRAAAQTALDDNKHLSSINNPNQDILKINMSQIPTVSLNTWAAQHHIPTQYVLLNQQVLPPSPKSPWNHPRMIFYYRLFLGYDFYFDGHGSSHQQARINCAYHALNFLHHNPTSIIVPTTQIQSKSPISLMYERAKQLNLSVQIEYNEPLTITYRIGEEYLTTGTGSSKHLAKQIAAEKMLEILPLPTEKEKANCKRITNQHKKFIKQKGLNNYSLTKEINPITRLYQIAQGQNKKIQFIELEKLSEEKLFHFNVQFDEDISADGYGQNKQLAKRSAAEYLLSKLNPDILESISILPITSLPPPPIKGLLKRDENSNKQQQEKKHVHFVEDEIIQDKKISDQQLLITIKQQLINACQKLNINIQYQDEITTNDNNQYESILSLSIDDRLLAKFRGNGSSSEDAQENASSAAWKNLEELFNGSIQTPKLTIKKNYHRVQTPISIQQQ